MRVDRQNPFADYRVRQAVALTLDRPAIIKTLFNGLADIGNDSPFAPVYGLDDTSVPQRKKNIAMAKQLMAAAGHAKGFSITLTTETTGEIPQLAQIVKQSVKAIGINMTLQDRVLDRVLRRDPDRPAEGLGQHAVAERPDQHHRLGQPRGAERATSAARYQPSGVWNAAHYSNKKFDALVQVVPRVDELKDQSKYAEADARRSCCTTRR